MKKFWFVILGVAVLVSVAWAIQTGGTDLSSKLQRRSLAGLEGVAVLVRLYSEDEPEKYGLRYDELKTITELGLRRNGIKVLTDEEHLKARGMPKLDVSITAIVSGSPDEENLVSAAATMISVEMRQRVILERDPAILYPMATTWERGLVQISTVKDISEGVKQGIKDFVDEFCNDYLAANPIRRTVPYMVD
jgi:hypothetical protein